LIAAQRLVDHGLCERLEWEHLESVVEALTATGKRVRRCALRYLSLYNTAA
jgi:hypothetical protein